MLLKSLIKYINSKIKRLLFNLFFNKNRPIFALLTYLKYQISYHRDKSQYLETYF